MAKKTKLPLTEELLKQVAPLKSPNRNVEKEYLEADLAFSQLSDRDKEIHENIHLLRQIRRLLHLSIFKE